MRLGLQARQAEHAESQDHDGDQDFEHGRSPVGARTGDPPPVPARKHQWQLPTLVVGWPVSPTVMQRGGIVLWAAASLTWKRGTAALTRPLRSYTTLTGPVIVPRASRWSIVTLV